MYRLTQQIYVFAYISTTNGVNFMTLVPNFYHVMTVILAPKNFLSLIEKEGKQKLNIFPCAEITENSVKASFTNLAEETLLPISGWCLFTQRPGKMSILLVKF